MCQVSRAGPSAIEKPTIPEGASAGHDPARMTSDDPTIRPAITMPAVRVWLARVSWRTRVSKCWRSNLTVSSPRLIDSSDWPRTSGSRVAILWKSSAVAGGLGQEPAGAGTAGRSARGRTGRTCAAISKWGSSSRPTPSIVTRARIRRTRSGGIVRWCIRMKPTRSRSRTDSGRSRRASGRCTRRPAR